MSETPAGITRLQDPGGREVLQLEFGDHRVVVARTGAQVLSWHTPAGDVLWTASYPKFEPGKPVRGGVPIVFPWFGDHRDNSDLPAHGFARNVEWQIDELRAGPDIVLSTSDTPETRSMWPHAFRLELQVALRESLRLALTISNTGDEPLTCEQALHSYYSVGDVREASVHGLQGVPFVESAGEPEGDWDASAPLHFRAETDRIFQGTADAISIEAPKLERTVRLRSAGARSAIVWNPWIEKTARLSQMDPDDYLHFCCVESANVGENATAIAPGERHTLELTIEAAQAAR